MFLLYRGLRPPIFISEIPSSITDALSEIPTFLSPLVPVALGRYQEAGK